MPISKMQINQK